jgi:hypothetical protein
MPSRKPGPKRSRKPPKPKTDKRSSLVKKRRKVVLATEIPRGAPVDLDKLYDRMHEEMMPLIQRHTVAIVAYYDGQYHQHATGTLVRIGDNFLVVTASHVIKDYREGKNYYADIALYIDNCDRLIRLGGDYSGSNTSKDLEGLVHADDGDDLDVAVWKLHPIVVKALTNKSFVNKSSISITADLTKGVYYLAGYPCSWSKSERASKVLHLRPLHYIAHPRHENSDLPGFIPRLHFALHIDPAGPTMPPKFKGISGCSIWKLSDEPASNSWSPSQAKIVAIQTAVHTKRGRDAVQGTKWRYVLYPLMDMAPEIRESLNVWIPGRE